MRLDRDTLRAKARELLTYVRELAGRAHASLRTMRVQGMTARQKRVAKLMAATGIVCVLFCAFMAWLIGAIVSDPTGFSQLIDQNFLLAATLYALVNTLQVFAAFIPGEPLELLAGYLFGTWGGLAIVSIGLALGEAIVFVTVKRHGPRLVHLFVSQEKLDELAFFNDPRRLNLITFLIMFIPGTPKDIMTYAIGLTPMTLGTWMAISIPARLFSIVTSTVVGAQAAEDNWVMAAFVFAVTCVISLFGMIYYLSISRQARQAAIMEEIGRREWEEAGCPTNDAASSPAAHGNGVSDNTADSFMRELASGVR